MNDVQLFSEFSSLPEHLKVEVGHFIAFLKTKIKPAVSDTRTLGLAKGKIVIRDNFDDPVPGFELYQ